LTPCLGVKHFANRNNIDLNVVKGTGKEGRVTKEDLINHMEGHSVAKVRSTPAVRAFAK
jgi:pyruvate/2-oxoglutarate dehydrogenase complex dihydrolipoamide acyltransferase (E2) component